MSGEATPIPPHMAAEFYVWFWWYSENNEGRFNLGDNLGVVYAWVDQRLSFRRPGDQKVSTVLTGENPAASLEARAALAGGKVLQDVRIGMRRDEREFYATLRGPAVHVGALKLPQVMSEGLEEQVYDRMFLYEEFHLVLGAILQQFADMRASSEWKSKVLPELRGWLAGKVLEPA